MIPRTNVMTQKAHDDYRNRGNKRQSCSPLMITEGMIASDEECTLSKFFSGYFLAVTMALVVLLIFLWFSWGRNKYKKEMAEIVKAAVREVLDQQR